MSPLFPSELVESFIELTFTIGKGLVFEVDVDVKKSPFISFPPFSLFFFELNSNCTFFFQTPPPFHDIGGGG